MVIEWRSPPGFPQYEISEYGVARRKVDYCDVNGDVQFPKGKILYEDINHGYVRYYMTDDAGMRRTVKAHRLVAETFLGPAPEGKRNALHKDDNKRNNHYTNLYWGSYSDNARDAIRNGKRLSGANHPNSTLSWEMVEQLRSEYSPGVIGYKALAKKYGLSREKVRDIVLNKIYRSEHSK